MTWKATHNSFIDP